MTKYVRGSERRWQVRVLPAQAQEWDTFLHVLIIGEAPVEASLVREGDREGVRLRRGEDLPEKTILFPSAPGERLGAPKTAGGKLVYTKGLLKRFAPLARVEIR
ncbi:MAG: hypothetical protein HY601_02800, partial [Candidatus Omnitrophica bacterium]|nr:hypothetical protein [Candidatus Omnitrophota bacterium]